MTDAIETRVGLDEKRIKENYKRSQKEVRNEQVLMFHRQDAWSYLIKNIFVPVLGKEEFIQTYLSLDLSEFNLQVLMDGKWEMVAYIDLLEQEGFDTYCYAKPQEDEDGNVEDSWRVERNYIRQVFYPSTDLMSYLENKFGDLGGKVWFRVNFDFYPIDNSECKIVDLGVQSVSYDKHIIELRCKSDEEED